MKPRRIEVRIGRVVVDAGVASDWHGEALRQALAQAIARQIDGAAIPRAAAEAPLERIAAGIAGRVRDGLSRESFRGRP